jgi:hypothetical protein
MRFIWRAAKRASPAKASSARAGVRNPNLNMSQFRRERVSLQFAKEEYMKISRRFTKQGQDVYSSVEWGAQSHLQS